MSQVGILVGYSDTIEFNLIKSCHSGESESKSKKSEYK